MESVDLESLIEQGKAIRKGLKYVPPRPGTYRIFSVYRLENESEYYSWEATCENYLDITYHDNPCIASFQQAAKAFEVRANHFCPQHLDKMIGILEGCKTIPVVPKTTPMVANGTEGFINQLECKRSLYKSFFQGNVNSTDCIEAYHNWYSESLVLFSQYIPSSNEDLIKFRSVDNSGNGFTLYHNYNDIQASYLVLLNQIKRGVYSEKTNVIDMIEKPPLLFISHSSKDEDFAESFVTLLRSLGFNKSNLFCSSIDGYGIDEGCDIYETLRSKFQQYNIYVVFLLSDNYYQSPACLNEMGAAWVLKTDYSTVLLPGFEIPSIKGAINPNRMAIIINDKHVRNTLNKFKERIMEVFNLEDVDDDIVWEKNRDKFLESVQTA